MKRIAIIPARAGSKRIPNKNIKLFNGKPIIFYSIEAAKNSNLFDDIMVSTDSEEIAEISKKFGANVPFIRSKKNSDDFATTSDVLIEVIQNYNKILKLKIDQACCIYPAAPLINSNILRNTFEKFDTLKFDSYFPVVKHSRPVLRSFIFENKKLKMKWPENKNIRSQDLEDLYYDAGMFYWFKVDSFKKHKTLLKNNVGGHVIDHSLAQDIDTIEDWEIAEYKFSLIK